MYNFRELLDKVQRVNENLTAEIIELKNKKEELESRLQEQNSNIEEMKRLHQQTRAENADTIRSLKVCLICHFQPHHVLIYILIILATRRNFVPVLSSATV